MYQFADEWGPESVFEVYDTKTKTHAVLVIDNTARGPGKGGIRMVPDVSAHEVFSLARAMTWKNSLADIPYGGAKCGIKADPKKADKEKIMRVVADKLAPLIPKYYIAGPDMNTTEKEMDAFANQLGRKDACTGKSIAAGGLPHELGSTGYGIVQATKVAAEYLKFPLSGATVALEGYGNVGTFTHKFISELGAKVIAISDSKGTAFLPSGLDYSTAMKIKSEKGTITAYPGAQIKPAADLFAIQADILIPGARPNVITEANVNSVKAKMVVEAANIPMSPAMEGLLSSRGVAVLPDFLVNAGGVISSHAELIGTSQEGMFSMVKDKITKNTQVVMEKSNGKNIRDAALAIAKARVKEAMDKKGM